MPSSATTIQLDAKSKAYLKTLRENASERTRVFSRLVRVMGKRGSRIAGDISKDFLAGQRLKIRSGALARSISSEASLVNGVPGVRVGIFRGPALPYAGVQEYGTQGKDAASPYPTIVPREAKALAMPLAPLALTPAGVPRYASPRDFPEALRFIPFRRGIAVGALYPESELKALRAGKGKGRLSLRNAKAAYLLLEKVDVKPHHFLQDGMAQALPFLAGDVGQEIARVMSGN